MSITLVSFPRSGRNWLCLLLDIYNGGPVFNNRINNPSNPDKDSSNFMGTYNHDHNSNKKISGRVIYLHRNPVDVIFSMINSNTIYVKKDKSLKTELGRVIAWSKRLKNHEVKWYHNTPLYCTDKYIIEYEDLINYNESNLFGLIQFIWKDNIVSKLRIKVSTYAITKEFVKEICREDNAIVYYSKKDKNKFITKYKDLIINIINEN